MFRSIIKQTASSLNSAKIPYMIIGGQAVLLYGEPRLTKVVDITLGVNVDRLSDILTITKKLDYRVLIENTEKFVQETMVLPAEDHKTGIRIDFIFSFSPYERQAIERAKSIKMDEIPVKYASVEDVIIHKIVAGRARDLEDVKSIVLKNPDYDARYVVSWLENIDESQSDLFLERLKQIQEKL